MNWYCLYTASNHEKRVLRMLEKQNQEAFLPTHTVVRQWSDRKKKLERPLFPNYIFIRTEEKNLWKALSISGVISPVKRENKPAIVEDQQIQMIRKTLGGEPEVTDETFTRNEFCKVTRGPLKGLEGYVVYQQNKTRIALQVQLINKFIVLETNPAYLEKVA
ncbi:MAG: UpxY family transcription antiterminator [Bacteroidota bacterium]